MQILNGNNVDWFFAYKLPVIETDRSSGYSSEGTAFIYADSTTNAWVMSQQSIGSESSAIGMTIKQIFQSSKQNDFYALYNDEHPNNKTDSGRGHMKGSLFYRLLFLPSFWKTKRSIFLCVTFPTAALNEIGKQLLFGTPSVYESNCLLHSKDSILT
uniref:Uncharacterized protein n=1 Tax=Ditylenchus dipsaci TaxID=166011 RepID=A0A915E5I5_9BILA